MSKAKGMKDFVEDMIRSTPEVSQPEKDEGFRKFAEEFEVMCARFAGNARVSMDAARAKRRKEGG